MFFKILINVIGDENVRLKEVSRNLRIASYLRFSVIRRGM